MKSELVRLVEQMYVFQDNYFVTMNCLHAMVRELPNAPLGRQLREIFCACHTKPIESLPQYREALLYLKVSSSDQLMDYMRGFMKILDDHFEHAGKSTATGCGGFPPVQFYEKITAISERLAMGDNLDYYDSDEYEKEEEDVKSLDKIKYTYQLQQRLRERKAQQQSTKKKTRFEKLRDEFIGICQEFFEKNLQPPVSLPLYESFYFSSTKAMKERLIPSPRLSIQNGLSDPYYYLKVKELEENYLITPHLPDISIVYKLHLESGSLINLYDWMKAFHVIVTSDEHGDVEKDIDDVTQARFIQAVSEMQLMGFIKPTKKKIDHIQRLTWT